MPYLIRNLTFPKLNVCLGFGWTIAARCAQKTTTLKPLRPKLDAFTLLNHGTYNTTSHQGN